MIFNDRDLRLGGRMYEAFWIGEKKIFRRVITIAGEKTSDIDSKAMHVQLLLIMIKTVFSTVMILVVMEPMPVVWCHRIR